MYEIQVESESGNWFRVDEPYKFVHVAITDANQLATRYGAHGHIRVVPVEG